MRLEQTLKSQSLNNKISLTLRLEPWTLESQSKKITTQWSSSLIDYNYIYIYIFLKEWFLPISLVLNKTFNFSFSFTILLWLEHWWLMIAMLEHKHHKWRIKMRPAFKHFSVHNPCWLSILNISNNLHIRNLRHNFRIRNRLEFTSYSVSNTVLLEILS